MYMAALPGTYICTVHCIYTGFVFVAYTVHSVQIVICLACMCGSVGVCGQIKLLLLGRIPLCVVD